LSRGLYQTIDQPLDDTRVTAKAVSASVVIGHRKLPPRVALMTGFKKKSNPLVLRNTTCGHDGKVHAGKFPTCDAVLKVIVIVFS
jgi:hypothetical protein